MTQADESKAALWNAIEEIQAAESLITGNIAQRAADVAALILRLKETLERINLDQLRAGERALTARDIAGPVIVGTAGEVSNVPALLQVVDEESDKVVASLETFIDQLDDFSRIVLVASSETNEKNIGYLRNAEELLNQYRELL